MDEFKIFEKKQRLPHRQAFYIRVSSKISEDDLKSLTQNIVEKEQTPSEFITCHWWRSDQDVEVEECWATSKWDGIQVSVNYCSSANHALKHRS